MVWIPDWLRLDLQTAAWLEANGNQLSTTVRLQGHCCTELTSPKTLLLNVCKTWWNMKEWMGAKHLGIYTAPKARRDSTSKLNTQALKCPHRVTLSSFCYQSYLWTTVTKFPVSTLLCTFICSDACLMPWLSTIQEMSNPP
jgi:hypothetical protein